MVLHLKIYLNNYTYLNELCILLMSFLNLIVLDHLFYNKDFKLSYDLVIVLPLYLPL